MTKRFNISEHPEFFKPTVCKNCGKEIFYSPWDTLHFHVEYERWEDDNGYYCSEDRESWADPVDTP